MYFVGAKIYIKNNIPTNEFEWLKGEIVHELFTHVLGWVYHSQDPSDISYSPAYDSNITTNEKNAKNIYLKLSGNTDLLKYEID